MSASLVSVIRSHLAELDGSPTVLLHPEDYDRHWLALCDIGHETPVVFWRDESVPRGCYRLNDVAVERYDAEQRRKVA